MRFSGSVVVVTGAGSGIGAAIARRAAQENARAVVISDIDVAKAERTATAVRNLGAEAIAVHADVSDPTQVNELVATTERSFGTPDLVCSNAGIATGMGVFAGGPMWTRSWEVNVLAHVHLAQALVPSMSVRRKGHFLITASAAGLLSLPGDAPYSVTKHAAVGFAEWLAMTYRKSGIGVSVLCPLGVRTDLLMPGVAAGHPAAKAVAAYAPILEPDQVAEFALQGVAEDRFMILPHAEVGEMYAKKAADPEGWLAEQGEIR